jgi:hypothetical protein
VVSTKYKDMVYSILDKNGQVNWYFL